MKEVLLLKCGEIVLKGLNRKTFEDRLLKNLKRRMAHVADCEISMRQSVVYVEIPDDADADAVMECASRVFGFATISRAAVCPEKTLESVIATAKDYLAANFAAAKTFKVETKRGDKKFPMTSTEISQHVGGELADLFPDVRPDMHHPDLDRTRRDAREVRLRSRRSGSGCGRHADRLERPCGAAALRRHRLPGRRLDDGQARSGAVSASTFSAIRTPPSAPRRRCSSSAAS